MINTTSDVPKVFKADKCENVRYKTMGTSIIYDPLTPPYPDVYVCVRETRRGGGGCNAPRGLK